MTPIMTIEHLSRLRIRFCFIYSIFGYFVISRLITFAAFSGTIKCQVCICWILHGRPLLKRVLTMHIPNMLHNVHSNRALLEKHLFITVFCWEYFMFCVLDHRFGHFPPGVETPGYCLPSLRDCKASLGRQTIAWKFIAEWPEG